MMVYLLLAALFMFSPVLCAGPKCRKFSAKVETGTCKGFKFSFATCQDAIMAMVTDQELSEGMGKIVEEATMACSVDVAQICSSLGPKVFPADQSCVSGGGMCKAFVGGMRVAECREDADCDGDTGNLKATAIKKPCCSGSKNLILNMCSGLDMVQLDEAVKISRSVGECVDKDCYDPSSAHLSFATRNAHFIAAAVVLLALIFQTD